MDTLAKGDRAKAILEDEVFQEAVERAQQRIKDEWGRSPTQQEREALWQRLQAIKAVPEALQILQDDAIMQRNRQEK